jgi:hypothetical protein
MNCPYCGKEMIKGKIRSRFVLLFSNDEEPEGFWMDRNIDENIHEISSNDTTVLHHIFPNFPVRYTAHHCADCQKFVFDGELIK